MKKIFTLLCAGFLCLTTLQAEVLLTEHFAQTTETLATNENAFANEIASTGWTNITGSGQVYMNTTEDLIYNGYKSATDNTGSAEYKATFGKKVATPLSKSINTGSIYAAAIFNFTACSPTAGRDYLWAFSLNKSSISTAGNHFGRLYAQKSTNNTFQLGIAKNAESPAFISYTGELAYGKYLIVMEYEFIDGEKNDIVRLYVNPVKGDKPTATIECKQQIENAEGTDVGSGTKDDPSQFASFMLYSTSATKLACLIDEIKVTTSWDDLWEAGGEDPDPDPTPVPSITAAGDLNFGNVNVNKEVSKAITVKGANLKSGIYINCTDPAINISALYVSKVYAETESGYELTVSLTATAEGEGSAKITFESEDATKESITATWSAVAPPDSVENIAELKGKTVYKSYVIKTQPIVVGFIKGTPIIQDESGALPITDMLGIYNGYSALKVGDQLQNIYAYMMDGEGKIDIFPAADLAGAPNLLSSDNEVIPLVGDPSNIASYGPAYIQLKEVQFPSDKDKFETGYLDVTQGSETVKLYILDGELIDTALPAKADVKGLVSYKSFNGKVLEVSKLSEITNREEKIPTAIDNINSSSLQGGERGRLFLHNGQIIILRDNKTFNLLGTEIK
ncbi:MAG: hypothetical protein ACI4AI_05080 [Paludibacteraceae bacterium]